MFHSVLRGLLACGNQRQLKGEKWKTFGLVANVQSDPTHKVMCKVSTEYTHLARQIRTSSSCEKAHPLLSHQDRTRVSSTVPFVLALHPSSHPSKAILPHCYLLMHILKPSSPGSLYRFLLSASLHSSLPTAVTVLFLSLKSGPVSPD